MSESKDKLDRLTREFIINEGSKTEPDLMSFIQSTLTLLDSISPRTKKDKNNLSTVKHNIKKIRRQAKRIARKRDKLEKELEELKESNE